MRLCRWSTLAPPIQAIVVCSIIWLCNICTSFAQLRYSTFPWPFHALMQRSGPAWLRWVLRPVSLQCPKLSVLTTSCRNLEANQSDCTTEVGSPHPIPTCILSQITLPLESLPLTNNYWNNTQPPFIVSESWGLHNYSDPSVTCVFQIFTRGPTRVQASIVYEISIFQKSRLDFWFHMWFQWFRDFTRDFPCFLISPVISDFKCNFMISFMISVSLLKIS